MTTWHGEDDYTTEIDPARAALIPAIQAAARELHETTEASGGDIYVHCYAAGVDDALSFLDGEVAPTVLNRYGAHSIARAAKGPSSARSYTVGLPVTVTVQPDGTVEYEVDTSEAALAIGHDDDVTYSDEELDADADAIDRDHERRVQCAQGNCTQSCYERKA